jgi:hypothetical protein
MMRALFFCFVPLSVMVLFPIVAQAQETAVVVDAMENPALYNPAQPELGHKWTGKVSLDSADFKEGKGSLRFDIQSAKSGEESYPQWGRGFDPAKNDWTRFKALRYWVKVVSDKPEVTFKNMCVVVYNGDSPFQQFVVHQVPVGRWVQLTDLILDYNRDRVRGIVLYMYETNPTWQDSYSWWVDGIELLPQPEGAVSFDGLALGITKEAARATQQTLGGRRLALGLDEQGRVTSFASDGRSLYAAGEKTHPYTGLMIRDWGQGEAITPVTCPVVKTAEGLKQEGSVGEGLRINATWRAAKSNSDWLECNVFVRDTQAVDRALTLYFALPVGGAGWTWWDDIRTPRRIEGTKEFISNPGGWREPRVSPYPYCVLGDDNSAVALATPLGMPRLQRMVYNPQVGVLYLAYNFCLTPAATKQKQTAKFTFYVAPADAAWGFRAMTADYYRAFPDYFVKRVPKEGGWGCWGTYAANPHIPELGFMYHWGPDTRGGAKDPAEPLKHDNTHGTLTFPYIEWTNMHVSMEKYETADNDAIMKQVRHIADPERKEKLEALNYTYPYDARMGPDYDGSMRTIFQAYLKSLIFTPEGLLYGGADKGEFTLLVAKYIPFNADPDIPGGAGEYFLTKWWPLIEKYYRDRGAKMDGFGWDNFYVRGSALDYRREHFAYADEPLTFDVRSLKPAILKDMSTYELQQAAVGKLRAMGRYLIANQGSISPVGATLPLLDIFGYEWNIANAATYARTLAHHKPVCSLPVQAAHYEEPFVREHLLYGAWPGGYYNTTAEGYLALMRKYVPIVRRLTQAGWEPITYVRCDDPAVQVERFGGAGKRPLLLSVRNGGKEDKAATLRLEAPLKATGTPKELVDGEACVMTQVEGRAAVTVQAPAGKVVVVAF